MHNDWLCQDYERAMEIFLYTRKNTEIGARLTRSIRAFGSLDSLIECWNFTDLLDCLNDPAPLPETVVFQAETEEELQALHRYRFRLEQVFFVLVLPSAEEQIIAKGHTLRPRFIAYQDSNFCEVCAVLQQLEVKKGGRGQPSLPHNMECENNHKIDG